MIRDQRVLSCALSQRIGGGSRCPQRDGWGPRVIGLGTSRSTYSGRSAI
jgi:hypothetical protein